MSRNPHRHLEVRRYAELNPVRAAMVVQAKDWRYLARVGQADVPAWLGSEELWGYLPGRAVDSDADLAQAQHAHADLVAAVRDASLCDESLNRQIYLDDDQFVGRTLETALPSAKRSALVPKVKRSATLTLAEWLAHCDSREEALRRAHVEGGLSMTAMAAKLGLTVGRISQLIAKAKINAAKEKE